MDVKQIRKAELSDRDSIWNIIEQVIAGGDTYVFAPDSDRTTMLDYWCGKDKHTYVEEIIKMTSAPLTCFWSVCQTA